MALAAGLAAVEHWRVLQCDERACRHREGLLTRRKEMVALLGNKGVRVANLRFCAYQYQHLPLDALRGRWRDAERSEFDVLWNGKFALVVRGGAATGVHDVLTTAELTEDVTASLSLATGAWMVALLKSAYLAACVHLREVPRTRDAQYVREIIRAGAFGTDPPVVGSGNDSVPFRVFRIYNATAEQARGVWMGVAFLPRAGDPVPIFGVGLGAVAFVTWPIPDLRQRAVRLALGKPIA